MNYMTAKVLIYIVILKSVCSENEDQKSSVTFAIDTTYSMTDDIAQVKESAFNIFTTVMNSNHSHIENFVLVTFGDPETNNKLQTITKDAEEYEKALASIESDAYPNEDCPEFSMAGIILALEKSLPSSYIYVFTDASAKDFSRNAEVKAIAQKKGSQVVFVLTGDCSGRSSSDYSVYNEIAQITSGQVFNIYKNEVYKILEYVKHITESRKSTILRNSFGPGNHTFSFDADSTITELIISSAGKDIKLSVFDPDNKLVNLEDLYKTSDNSVAIIRKTKNGTYTGTIDGGPDKTLTIHATTDVHFRYGFSTFRPRFIHNLPTEPLQGMKSHLAIQLTGNPKNIRLKAVNLFDLDDNIIAIIPLIKVNRENFYRTEPTNFPTTSFKISVIGSDTSNRTPFKRTSSTFIQEQDPKLLQNNIQNVSPKVSIEGWPSQAALYKHALELRCVVTAYPKPRMLWQNKNTGETLKSSILDLEPPLVYMNILQIERATKDQEYVCRALNDYGQDNQTIQIKIKEKKVIPVLDTSTYNVNVNNGSEAIIQCRILKGLPKPKIKWYFKGLNSYDYIDIDVTGETMRKLKALPRDAGDYKCVAENSAGRFEHETTLTVEYAPQITSVREYFRARNGEHVTLPCVVIGVPVPKVQWLTNGHVITTIQRNNGAVTDYSLQNIVATTNHSGNYICIAENQHGSASKTLHLKVFVGVTIEAPQISNITVNVGSRVALPCVADGSPKPIVYWEFLSKNNAMHPTFTRANSMEKVLPRIQLNQEGTYICIASNNHSSANITYEVHVQAPPQIIDLAPDNVYTAVAEDAYLLVPCNAIGNPKPTITWLRDREFVSLGSQWYDMDDNGTLILKNVNKLSGGEYTCRATNDLGSAYMTYKVVVQPYPESQLPSSTKLLMEGQTAEIPCTIPRSIIDTLRWYKNGILIKRGELILDRVSFLQEGIYTCRVSSLIRSVSESTRIEVGSKPRFIKDTLQPIQYEEGIDVFMDCDAEGKPNPNVEWRFDGKLLTFEMTYILRMEVDTTGEYTCNVSNALGNVQRSFRIVIDDCLLNVENDLHVNNPIILSRHSKTFKNENGHLRIPHNEEVLMKCPGGFEQYPGQDLVAKCDQESIFIINKEPRRYQDITCNKYTPIARNTNRNCLGTWNHNIIVVGFETSAGFLNVYEVCMNMRSRSLVYAKQYLDENSANNKHEFSWIDSNLLEYDMESIYDCQRQADFLSSHLGNDFQKNYNCCFTKRQLVNSRDLPPGGLQKAAFIDLNVIPHWSTCGSENWEEVEQRVRGLVKSLRYPLTVYTGISYKTPKSKNFRDYYIMDKHGNLQVVPKFLWKIVKTPESSALAIIHVNVPELPLAEAHKYLLCQDVCHQTDWMNKPDWRDVKKGFTYCCNVPEFFDAFELHVFDSIHTTPLIDSTTLTKIY